MSKNVVYTALFGDYDDLIEPSIVNSNCDFVCFTDQKNITSKVWKIRLVEDTDLPPNLLNRRYKLLSHLYLQDYDSSLYVDSNVGIKKDPSELFLLLSKENPIIIPKHPFRNCAYDELDACEKSGKIDLNLKMKLKSKFLKECFPKNYGLTENGIMLRKHDNKKNIILMEQWYDFVKNNCARDQISLPYLAWKNAVNIGILKESVRRPNCFFYYRPHKKSGTEFGFYKRIVFNISMRRADNYFYYYVSRFLDFISGLFERPSNK